MFPALCWYLHHLQGIWWILSQLLFLDSWTLLCRLHITPCFQVIFFPVIHSFKSHHISCFHYQFCFWVVQMVPTSIMVAWVTNKHKELCNLQFFIFTNLDSAHCTKCSKLPAEFRYFSPQYSHHVFNGPSMSMIGMLSNLVTVWNASLRKNMKTLNLC